VACTQNRIENYCPIRTIEFHLDMLILWAHLTWSETHETHETRPFFYACIFAMQNKNHG
jgi:hypothetical protein